MYYYFIFFILMVFLQFTVANSSLGDTYPSYRFCVQQCLQEKCKNEFSYIHPANENVFITMLWSCYGNCEYECMWPFIQVCMKKRWSIPQFYGKWPFIRFFGMQEPASVVFSLLNLMSTLYMYKKFYKSIYFTSSMYWTWIGYTLVSVNTWLWSIVFHIRDLPFTERMDYIGASLMIYYTFFTFGFRMLIHKHVFVKMIFICGCLLFMGYHILYLTMTYLDYSHNFEMLIVVGLLCGVTTLLWCMWNWSKMPHLVYAVAYFLLTMLFAMLEIFDFAPILWVFDAHSLWHLSTVPLPFILYKFAIEDCRYLRRPCHPLTIATVD